ncbi:acyl-CoA thioesterase II [Actinomadura madurae]|uniref:acyl-CoA thioesterase n=1 Tax=Actinomadura madurae TaxID=1993 RepID=UPI00202644A2|nr:acyl-CoA thioesterase II [Actinomadura madurae]URM93970.1 acyl-CoA thioesterase II [Actinomadura madurae]URN04692.1 acyl-CoA thioesterase II [Actinomadura madurae]
MNHPAVPPAADGVRPDGAAPDVTTLLTLQAAGPDVFRAGARGAGARRVFGGQLLGQALVAAGRTVGGRRLPHSLHAHFLLGGDATLPLDYHVDRIRDGSAFSARRVTARQAGKKIFVLTASFHDREDGWSHQIPRAHGRDPDTLPPGHETMAAAGEHDLAWFRGLTKAVPLDLRFDGPLCRVAAVRGEPSEPRQRFWFRTPEELPADPLVHLGATAFASDVLLLSVALAPHARFVGGPGLVFASLDHAVWFHRAFRADEWLLYEQESPWAGNGRALCRGLVFDRDGELVASVTQEALIRPSS